MSIFKNDVRRAAPPAVLLSEDVQIILGLHTRAAAARLISKGEFGPPIRLGRRWAVLRESFLAALESRAGRSEARMHALSSRQQPRGADHD